MTDEAHLDATHDKATNAPTPAHATATATAQATAEAGPQLAWLNGAELFVEVLEGDLPADEGAQPTVVYVHGGPGYNSASFGELLRERLEALPNPVALLDGRGCGRSGPLEETEQGAAALDLDTLVADLEAVRLHLGAPSIIPLGHGFGALVALEYARRHPDTCARAVVVNPWLHFPQLALTLLAEASALRGLELGGTELSDPADEVRAATPEGAYPQVGAARVAAAFELLNARDLLAALQFPRPQERMRLEFVDAETQLAARPEVAEALVMQGMWEFEYPDFLPQITRPVFVIAGLHDRTSYPKQTEWLARELGTDITVLDAGHYPWLDDEDAFLEALTDDLSR